MVAMKFERDLVKVMLQSFKLGIEMGELRLQRDAGLVASAPVAHDKAAPQRTQFGYVGPEHRIPFSLVRPARKAGARLERRLTHNTFAPAGGKHPCSGASR